MFSHRPAKSPDFEKISTFPATADELYFMAPNAPFPLTARYLEALADERDAPTVLTLNGAIAGYACLYQRDGHRFIGNVIVGPVHRGKGAAKALINAMCEIARNRFGAPEIRLSCAGNNTTGLLLYAKLGFTPYAIAERTGFGGDRCALIHMQRALDTL
jgi:ribosomal protein S18 acetylase RimI-like enzyme